MQKRKVTVRKFPACGNPNCNITIGRRGEVAFGHGALLTNGYWENECYICARAYEQYHNNDKCKAAWPYMNGNDFIEVCKKAQKLTSLLITTALHLFKTDEKLKGVLGLSILANRKKLSYADISNSPLANNLLNGLVTVCSSKKNKQIGFTVFPDEVMKSTADNK